MEALNYILFDGDERDHLLPFTFTRPVCEIRIGILTIKEKWEHFLAKKTSYATQPYLQEKYSLKSTANNMYINGVVLTTRELIESIAQLEEHCALYKDSILIAYHSKEASTPTSLSSFTKHNTNAAFIHVNATWKIFSENKEALEADYKILTEGRTSQPISDTNRLTNPEQIFLEEGAVVEHSILNATEGSIYIGKNAAIWEGSLIRGGLALCEGATIKMGAKIYGATTVGPHSKVGGEVSNSVIFGYSSKGHDGFLGNAVLGEWCNLGADTNNSNLKNNYAKVRLWNYATEKFEHTALQFCGLMMGDHSKTAINTMLNTGTVIGVNCNIYTPGFPRNFVPDFSWGGATGFSPYVPSKVFEVAKVVMGRRNITFSDTDAAILNHVFEITKKWRKQ